MTDDPDIFQRDLDSSIGDLVTHPYPFSESVIVDYQRTCLKRSSRIYTACSNVEVIKKPAPLVSVSVSVLVYNLIPHTLS